MSLDSAHSVGLALFSDDDNRATILVLCVDCILHIEFGFSCHLMLEGLRMIKTGYMTTAIPILLVCPMILLTTLLNVAPSLASSFALIFAIS